MVQKILIVDDERPARLNLINSLKDYGQFQVVAEASNGEDAIGFCKENTVDIVFLDIQLQDMTGFDVANELMALHRVPKIIFATAYNQYAIEAFEYSAIDYLLKPIDDIRFKKTMEKLLQEKEVHSEKALDKVKVLLEKHLDTEHKKQKITLEKEGKLFVLCINDIIFIETDERNTKVVSKRGIFISNVTMVEWTERLEQYGFFRPHRSFLINLDEIDEVIPWFNHSFQVKMRGYGQGDIPISRNKAKVFKGLVGLD
ncbi:two component transcriptional regulator, LytTR family [Alkaliphilus metalliredigens QYMF]|uniref:Stage 0 sporulation protein A homolog n=1 Tax=Alkaliphilus metalliredigens (strain QYMF) TaxID=293826 RepID=A6TN10_ALKMQ|nr:LytTR family DNA-binding domain-containing protein [Alkaliphilus metalliredigens]ABR47578.1 two component transcriptional regulator, LytTR family [Alkaliphilus metalliredigens QYMF]